MGFDLIGANPSSRKGKYFRNTITWWFPLWDFVCENCSDILDEEDVREGNSNDRHFIERDKTMHISKRLGEMIKNGAVKKYEQAYREHIENLPDEVCYRCEGKGWVESPKELFDLTSEDLKRRGEILTAFRKDPDSYQVIREICHHCHGKGKARPQESAAFSERNVKVFAEFCAESGGFVIT